MGCGLAWPVVFFVLEEGPIRGRSEKWCGEYGEHPKWFMDAAEFLRLAWVDLEIQGWEQSVIG